MSEQVEKAGTPRLLTREEIDGYIRRSRRSSYPMALAAMLLVFSPITLVVLYLLAENGILLEIEMASMYGMMALFVFAGLACGIFIYNAVKLNKYDYIRAERFEIGREDLSDITEQAADQQEKTMRGKMVGIGICIMSLLPFFVVAVAWPEDVIKMALSIGMLLLISGIGLSVAVGCELRWRCYKVLLEEGNVTREQKNIDNMMLRKISKIFWPLILVVYLAWSFMSGSWGITWIIWPSAGAIYYVIIYVCNSFVLYKNR